MATWRKLINEATGGRQIIACTLTEAELDVEFDDGYGAPEGKPFGAWCALYVYFPVIYDGAENVGRAPRYPCNEATPHQGGY